jgi:hypothetical protein
MEEDEEARAFWDYSELVVKENILTQPDLRRGAVKLVESAPLVR